MQQKELIIILADISGYTRFLVENRKSARHGQLCINSLIESIPQQVDIPLTLQEIEGDAVYELEKSQLRAGGQATGRGSGSTCCQRPGSRCRIRSVPSAGLSAR